MNLLPVWIPLRWKISRKLLPGLKYRNIGILITDHNVNETLSICDRAYLLIDGKIFKHGTAEELAADEQVRRLYLGRNFELKRKDYLHQEAALDRVSIESVIQKIEKALTGLENIERIKNERIHGGSEASERLRK